MATVAEEIAALRGTKPATFKDLLGPPVVLPAVAGHARLVAGRLGRVRRGRFAGGPSWAASRLGGLAVAGVMLARLLPSVLFGPFAGVLVDRFDRRKVMIDRRHGRGACYASMPFVPALWVHLLRLVLHRVAVAAVDAGQGRQHPEPRSPPAARQRELGRAWSRRTGRCRSGRPICTALAGVSTGLGRTIPYFGEHPEFLALWLDALTFLFSAWMVSGLDLRPVTGQVHAGRASAHGFDQAWADIREGFRFLRAHPLIRAMTLGIVIAFGGAGAVISLGPIFARYTVDAGSTGFGILMIALGVGHGHRHGLPEPAREGPREGPDLRTRRCSWPAALLLVLVADADDRARRAVHGADGRRRPAWPG